jgi:hypothetical protein
MILIPFPGIAFLPLTCAGGRAGGPGWARRARPAGALLALLIVVAAPCWTITDAGHTGRLAMLIDASRGNDRQPPVTGHRALPAAGSERRSVR